MSGVPDPMGLRLPGALRDYLTDRGLGDAAAVETRPAFGAYTPADVPGAAPAGSLPHDYDVRVRAMEFASALVLGGSVPDDAVLLARGIHAFLMGVGYVQG